jgi:uncharacterized protein
MNLLADLSQDKLDNSSFSWAIPPLTWTPLPRQGMRVQVPSRVDYFRDPAGVMVKDDAPYLYLEHQGDFVAQAHICPAFTSTWDAGAIMVRHDAQYWAKLCYEKTDFDTTAAVSVVTNIASDDANGVNLTTPDIWFQVCRVGDVFGMYYGLDDQSWRMVRIFKLPVPALIKVGLVAQCPVGPGTTIDFLAFSIETRTIKNLRTGV